MYAPRTPARRLRERDPHDDAARRGTEDPGAPVSRAEARAFNGGGGHGDGAPHDFRSLATQPPERVGESLAPRTTPCLGPADGAAGRAFCSPPERVSARRPEQQTTPNPTIPRFPLRDGVPSHNSDFQTEAAGGYLHEYDHDGEDAEKTQRRRRQRTQGQTPPPDAPSTPDLRARRRACARQMRRQVDDGGAYAALRSRIEDLDARPWAREAARVERDPCRELEARRWRPPVLESPGDGPPGAGDLGRGDGRSGGGGGSGRRHDDGAAARSNRRRRKRPVFDDPLLRAATTAQREEAPGVSRGANAGAAMRGPPQHVSVHTHTHAHARMNNHNHNHAGPTDRPGDEPRTQENTHNDDAERKRRRRERAVLLLVRRAHAPQLQPRLSRHGARGKTDHARRRRSPLLLLLRR